MTRRQAPCNLIERHGSRSRKHSPAHRAPARNWVLRRGPVPYHPDMPAHDDTHPEKLRQAQGLTSLGITLVGTLLAYALRLPVLAVGAALLALGSVWWHEHRIRRYVKWHMRLHPDCDQLPYNGPTMGP